MSSASPPVRPAGPPRVYNPMAGLLSYLVPGLGQITQGRVAKGVLFLVCIYTLFFYGLYLGSGSVKIGERTYTVTTNVFLPDSTGEDSNNPVGLPPLGVNLYNRPQFAGQFWVGVAAWPAILQYAAYDRTEVQKIERDLEEKYRAAVREGEDRELMLREAKKLEEDPRMRHPFLGQYQREPSAASINAVHNAGDKRLELGWVYTVIAGVLNIMVIYDAIAGPAFLLSGSGSNPTGKGS
jgi:hypothetical protein